MNSEPKQTFPKGPRLDLTACAGLSKERWNLLPGDSMSAGQLEPSLAWQESVYPTMGAVPRVRIHWSPDFSDPNRVAKVLGSIAAQSVNRFSLRISADEEKRKRRFPEFGKFVSEDRAMNLEELSEALDLGSRMDEGGLGDGLPEADWILCLESGDCLHPMALFCFLKEAMTGPVDLVGFFETLTDPSTGGPHAVSMNRGISMYSVLGGSGLSRSLFIASECYRKMAVQEGPGGSWPVALEAIRREFLFRKIPLALTAVESVRGDPYRSIKDGSRMRSLIEKFSESQGVPLQDWDFDETHSSGRPRPLSSEERIAVIIPFRDQEELTAATFRSLARQSVAEKVRLVAVDNGSSGEVAKRLKELAHELFGSEGVCWLRIEEPFNFALLNNRGVAASDEPHLLFLNNDVEFLGEDDLAHLQGFLEWPEVGMAGGALRYPDGQLQAAGIRFGSAGPEVVRSGDAGAMVFREVEALTFACAIARRDAFMEAGGLDEVICPNGFGDALLGYRMRKAGWRILCDPSISIRHHESKSRGVRPEELERFELSREGLPIYLYGTEFSVEGQEMVQRFGRSHPTLGKKIYRAFKAFKKELKG